ncbi:stress responsive A/B barrel domain protein [Leptodontidium sp. 2 PMI_412]|nr:stress responsive A/B barrel domain protein [Leptodontidium sp. 2 PMI_412]
MTLIHIVLGKCKPEITQEQKDTLVREIKALKTLPSVKDGRLIVGGPSLTDPAEWSKGFEFACVSYHENLAALQQYQATKEYHRITSTYVFPFSEDVCGFDFEVDPEDEYMCAFGPLSFLAAEVPGQQK